jgi:nicotinate-nucleotide pyrophosphorylase (carboxylating)
MPFFVTMNTLTIDEIIGLSLAEDIGTGDLTTESLNIQGKEAEAEIIAKQDGILAGIDIAIKVFKTVNSKVVCIKNARDGEFIKKNNRVLSIKGKNTSLLKAERVALNFLQRMSGIATITRQFVDKVSNTGVEILDTRKTTPLLRELEKYAVRMGGGYNHRMGLYDAILIKENHIKSVGSITEAIKRIRSRNANLFIEVEVKNLNELKEAIEQKVGRIMLDNMSISEIKEAVRIVGGTVELEISGGVNIKDVKKLAKTGVNYISVGALTHSYNSLDFSMLFK